LSDKELAHQVILLRRQGMSGRAIARAVRVSRKLVSKLLREHERDRSSPPLAIASPPARQPRASKLDTHRETIEGLLSRFPDITAQRVFEEIRRLGFDGGYTVVKGLVRKMRPKPTPTASQLTEKYDPGEMAESDWSPYTILFTRAPAKTLQCFGYTLVWSHRKFFRFYSRCDLYALMDGHVEAFTAFGGVASRCKYDSQKTVVERWEGSQPIYNLRFIDFATYYEFRPVACRPRHPNDKPHVERSFWELERSFFNGREFADEQDLADQLEGWRTGVSDLRPHPKTKTTPVALFAEERSALLALPQHPYDTARVIYRLCDIEGYVAWEGNRYSLPYEHVTDILPVRVTQRELHVYAVDLKLIARHELRPKGAGCTVDLPGHRPAAARRGPDLDQLRVAFEGLGPQAAAFFAELVRAQPRSAAYHARHVLGLRDRYPSASLVKALEHAERFGAFEHAAVERILVARSAPRRLDEYVAEATARKLAEVMGESVTEPRDLAEYDRLPCWSRHSAGAAEGDQPCAKSERQHADSQAAPSPPAQHAPPAQADKAASQESETDPSSNDSRDTSNGSV
jgi:transposase